MQTERSENNKEKRPPSQTNPPKKGVANPTRLPAWASDLGKRPTSTSLPARSTSNRVQMKPDDDATEATPEAVADTAPEVENATTAVTSGLIVDDSVEELAPGQMRKSDFLAQLRDDVCATAERALAGTIYSSMGCPWIDYWFNYYGDRSSNQIERAIRKYAPDSASVASADEYIPIISERVRSAIAVWATTGEVTGVPEGISTDLSAPAAPSGGEEGASSMLEEIAGLFPKSIEGAGGKAAGGTGNPNPQAVRSQLGAGQPLDAGVRSGMEEAFGVGLSHVRVHTDPRAASISKGLQARAFTVGEHVAFGPGEYQPGTLVGDALIAHELAHVAQQSGTTASAGPMQKGGPEYGALEEDADLAAVGAVSSIWGGVKGAFANLGANTLPSLRSGLRLQRCDDSPSDKDKAQQKAPEGGLQSGPGKTPGQPATPSSTPSTTPTPASQVASVRSLAMGELSGNIPGQFTTVQSRLKVRNKRIDEELGLVKAGSDQHTLLTKMRDRWAGLKDTSTSADLSKLIADEKADLPSIKNTNVKDAVSKFLQGLETWLGSRQKLEEERVEFARFDSLFVDADVLTILGAIPGATFTAADLKALVSQETGDLTNINVAGITGKKKGITSERVNTGHIGLGQHTEAARDAAIRWASTNGVTIPSKPDPRTVPAQSIKLTAAFLGETARLLQSGLPSTQPTGIEFKRMVFAAYNGGQVHVIKAAKEFVGTATKTYTWNDIKNRDDVTVESRNYVVQIESRL